MTVEQIESIEFIEIGLVGYKLKKVEIISPLVNVAGLTKIGNDYYTKIYPPELNSMHFRSKDSSLTIFNNLSSQRRK